MRHRLVAFLCLAALSAFTFLAKPVGAQQSCEKLMSLKIPNATIVSATAINPPPDLEIPIPASPMGPATTLKISSAFCRVVAFSTPTSDSHIAFEVWLPPAAKWNGKFEGVGNGGFIGQITYRALATGLRRGYAVAGSDTGHASGNDESWALGHPEKLIDWSYRAVHEVTVDSKLIIQAFYGSSAKLAYWDGCSTGGKQGLTEAQRYPNDFDGIVAGAPANYITHLQAGSEYISWVALKGGLHAPGYIPESKLAVIHEAALAACDAKDGVRDGVITDPRRCHFAPKTIQCSGADTPDCLTSPQVQTVEQIYAGARFADGRQIFPGFEVGSEKGWGGMTSGPKPFSIGTGFFKYMVFGDPKWDFRTFNVDRDTRLADQRLGKIVNAIDPNLKSFEAHGGKIVMYHGWADQAIAPGNSINYYNSVVGAMGGAEKTQEFLRLFMAPGMGHCQGGDGPDTFDSLGALEQWREHGTPPAKIIASHSTNGTVKVTRPLCPYPQVAIYKGTGSTHDAANFVCGNPTW
ncbi:MAG TPA: tannase/feruloyl esterase family alpha/beta hydrolase [Candidatus Polarisedimenticolia bacterium]|nr:tannase/feruloyl esterase family alpha/beta hydrolase [Candidatus Polarisedimenticolia bacterium]